MEKMTSLAGQKKAPSAGSGCLIKRGLHATLIWLAIVLTIALSIGGQAMADISPVELVAGGLALVKTDSIAIQGEDLILSPSEVRVRYEMRNDTGKPVTLQVAFPMPDLTSDLPGGLQNKSARDIAMPSVGDADFIAFRTAADGQEMATEVDITATLKDGRDVTEALRRIGGLSLVLHQHKSADLNEVANRTLGDLGALDNGSLYHDLTWITRISFHWMQTFRPGVTVLDVSYRPIVSSHIFAVTPSNSLDIAALGKYCVDASTERVIRAFVKRLAGRGQIEFMAGYSLGYRLKTAQNWRGRIGSFHLTLQGTRMHTEAGYGEPRIFSLCTELPLRQIAPMRFEALVRGYDPVQDLLVLILAE